MHPTHSLCSACSAYSVPTQCCLSQILPCWPLVLCLLALWSASTRTDRFNLNLHIEATGKCIILSHTSGIQTLCLVYIPMGDYACNVTHNAAWITCEYLSHLTQTQGAWWCERKLLNILTYKEHFCARSAQSLQHPQMLLETLHSKCTLEDVIVSVASCKGLRNQCCTSTESVAVFSVAYFSSSI